MVTDRFTRIRSITFQNHVHVTRIGTTAGEPDQVRCCLHKRLIKGQHVLRVIIFMDVDLLNNLNTLVQHFCWVGVILSYINLPNRTTGAVTAEYDTFNI